MKANFLHVRIVCLISLTIYQVECINNDGNSASSVKSDDLCSLGCECPPYGMFSFLVCSNKGITKLPENLHFQNEIEGITFRENTIPNITRKSFSFAPHLKEIDLSHNGLTSIENGSFSGFVSLICLRLSENKLKEVGDQLLQGLQNLNLLELGHNQISRLPPAFFKETPYLKELKLQYNNLRTLDENSFQYLDILVKLDLDGNGLDTLHPNLFQHTPRLMWLSLSANEFEVSPKQAFQKVPTLKSLDLSSNSFIILEPRSFSTLFNLSSLYLNNLDSLISIQKDAFHNMTSLKLLSCSYNINLRYVHPEAFVTYTLHKRRRMLPSEKLFLDHNNLRTLDEPADIKSWMTRITTDLDGNPWQCDCRIRWMTRLDEEISSKISCDSPLVHHGRTINHMSEKEFVCDDHWAFSTLILVLTSFVAFLVCLTFATVVACYKTPCGKYVRAKSQFTYAKVDRTRESLDLDWDPTGV